MGLQVTDAQLHAIQALAKELMEAGDRNTLIDLEGYFEDHRRALWARERGHGQDADMLVKRAQDTLAKIREVSITEAELEEGVG